MHALLAGTFKKSVKTECLAWQYAISEKGVPVPFCNGSNGESNPHREGRVVVRAHPKMTITQLNFKTVSQENPLFNDKIIIQISKKIKFLLPHKSILFAINKLFRPVPSRVKIPWLFFI